METNYKSNSHKSRERKKEGAPEKKIEKVISGTAKTKKKSGLAKLSDVFIAEDMSAVKEHILFDVLIPGCKKAILDTVDMFLYGGGSTVRRGSNTPKVSYGRYYERGNDRGRSTSAPARARNSFNFDDIIIPSRGDAEKVLDNMDEIIDTYNVVSVGDFYDLVGISDNNPMIHRYGWTNIGNAKPVRCRDGGYILDLPKALPID